jgi:hypothetical protein
MPVKSFPYLTVIPDRRPVQKVHTGLGQAKNAILFRDYGRGIPRDCQVYEWSNEGWTLLWDIPAGATRDEMPWNVKEVSNG